MNHQTKVSIIGCGKVGMTAAYSLMHGTAVSELLLIGRCRDDLVGEQLDLEHATGFLSTGKIGISDDYRDTKGSDVVIITAGAATKPGESRLDLAAKNKAVIDTIIPPVVRAAPDAIIVIVSNPVDVLTYHAYQLAGLPKGRILGTGTLLDTARFRFHLSEHLKVNPRSIHAYILGEHGDSSFPALTSATVGGQPLLSMNQLSERTIMQAYERARTAAYKIIESKGSTYYAIGAVVSHLVRAILTDARSIMPLSVPLHNYHGFSGVSLSVPCVIGREGVIDQLEIKLGWEEKEKLERSVNVLRQFAG